MSGLRMQIREWYKRMVDENNREDVWFSLITAMSFLCYVNPAAAKNITFFNRTFSNALLLGVDYSSRIHSFELFFLFVFPLLFIISFAVYYCLFDKETVLGYVAKKGILLMGCMLPLLLVNQETVNGQWYCYAPVGFTALWGTVIIFAFFSKRERKDMLAISDIYHMTISAIFWAVDLCLVFRYVGILNIKLMWLFIYMLFLVTQLFFLFQFKNPDLVKKVQLIMQGLTLATIVPTAYCIYVEIYYIMSGYGNILLYPEKIQIVGCIVLLATVVFLSCSKLFLKIDKRKMAIFTSVMGIVGFTLLLYSPGRISPQAFVNEKNIFELGNAYTCTETVIRGKIPFAEFFSAHGLTDNFTRTLYGVINNFKEGMFNDPYLGLYILASTLIVYFIVKDTINSFAAFAIVLIVPMWYYGGMRGQSPAMLSIPVLLYVLKKNTTLSYISLWVSLAFGVLIELDVGFSVGIAVLIVVSFLSLSKKFELKKLKFILIGFIVATFFFLMFVLGCQHSDVALSIRIHQFLSASLGSNSTWAMSDIVHVSKFVWVCGYYGTIVMSVVLLGGGILFTLKKQCFNLGIVVLLVFCCTTLLNIPRTLVFHLLPDAVVIRYLPWVFSYGVYMIMYLNKRSDLASRFLLAYVSSIVVFGNVICESNPPVNNLFEQSLGSLSRRIDVVDLNAPDVNLSRYSMDDSLKNFTVSFKQIFDYLLDDKETFVDFANLTSLYALTGRERPFYVAQSPSLLTDEFSQKAFIEEIEKADTPLLIMGYQDLGYTTQMIGISHQVRYYKCVEYFYQNYRPLVLVDDKYAIWCKNDKYGDYSEKVAKLNMPIYQLIQPGYDAAVSGYNHVYDIAEIPYIWGNYDKKKAWENAVVQVLPEMNPGNFVIDSVADKINGNYMIFNYNARGVADGNNTETITVCDMNENPLYRYTFYVHEGMNRYLVRISADSYWYQQDCFVVRFGNAWGSAQNVSILLGD